MCYRRADVAGDTYCFIVNLAERRSDVLVRHVDCIHCDPVNIARSFTLLVGYIQHRMVTLSGEWQNRIWGANR